VPNALQACEGGTSNGPFSFVVIYCTETQHARRQLMASLGHTARVFDVQTFWCVTTDQVKFWAVVTLLNDDVLGNAGIAPRIIKLSAR